MFRPRLFGKLVTFRALVLSVSRDSYLERSPVAFITDASSKGFAMLEGRSHPNDAKRLRSWNERWGFREVHSASTGPRATSSAVVSAA